MIELPTNYDALNPRQRKAVRERYITIQKGKCYHCGEPLLDQPTLEMMKKRVTPSLYPPNFFDHPVHLHHSHDTGLTIGAVHAYCNAVLWEHHGE